MRADHPAVYKLIPCVIGPLYAQEEARTIQDDPAQTWRDAHECPTRPFMTHRAGHDPDGQTQPMAAREQDRLIAEVKAQIRDRHTRDMLDAMRDITPVPHERSANDSHTLEDVEQEEKEAEEEAPHPAPMTCRGATWQWEAADVAWSPPHPARMSAAAMIVGLSTALLALLLFGAVCFGLG